MLLTENARLETGSVSSQGAIGLMQVMRFHAGEYDCESDDLIQVESNICHGARVFGQYLKRTGDVRRALLRYNGCVTGANTPNCGRYPNKVLRTARSVRYEQLRFPAWRLEVGLDTVGERGGPSYRPQQILQGSPTFFANPRSAHPAAPVSRQCGSARCRA